MIIQDCSFLRSTLGALIIRQVPFVAGAKQVMDKAIAPLSNSLACKYNPRDNKQIWLGVQGNNETILSGIIDGGK